MGRTTTITLDQRHFKAAVQQARELGKTPERYVASLIDAAALTFDEILVPVRSGFAKSGVTERELDTAVLAARKAIHARRARRARK